MSREIVHAGIEDLAWVNEQYRSIGFLPSDGVDETIVIARVNGERAGLGRLKRIDADSAELGGIYVFPSYRKKGVAAAVVASLVAEGKRYKTLYCLPFEHLRAFYESYGFIMTDPDASVPADIRKKLAFCGKTYESRVLLLILNSAFSD